MNARINSIVEEKDMDCIELSAGDLCINENDVKETDMVEVSRSALNLLIAMGERAVGVSRGKG